MPSPLDPYDLLTQESGVVTNSTQTTPTCLVLRRTLVIKVHPPHLQAGLIEEMMEDTFEGLEDEDLEEQADAEVEKILWEVTSGKGDNLATCRL